MARKKKYPDVKANTCDVVDALLHVEKVNAKMMEWLRQRRWERNVLVRGLYKRMITGTGLIAEFTPTGLSFDDQFLYLDILNQILYDTMVRGSALEQDHIERVMADGFTAKTTAKEAKAEKGQGV